MVVRAADDRDVRRAVEVRCVEKLHHGVVPVVRLPWDFRYLLSALTRFFH